MKKNLKNLHQKVHKNQEKYKQFKRTIPFKGLVVHIEKYSFLIQYVMKLVVNNIFHKVH